MTDTGPAGRNGLGQINAANAHSQHLRALAPAPAAQADCDCTFATGNRSRSRQNNFKATLLQA